jgi:predicted GIY-YIG superfamily endonuclease
MYMGVTETFDARLSLHKAMSRRQFPDSQTEESGSNGNL